MSAVEVPQTQGYNSLNHTSPSIDIGSFFFSDLVPSSYSDISFGQFKTNVTLGSSDTHHVDVGTSSTGGRLISTHESTSKQSTSASHLKDSRGNNDYDDLINFSPASIGIGLKAPSTQDGHKVLPTVDSTKLPDIAQAGQHESHVRPSNDTALKNLDADLINDKMTLTQSDLSGIGGFCSISACGKGPFSSNSALLRHIRSHDPQHVCSECPLRFNTRFDLSRHWDSKHDSERLFPSPKRTCNQSRGGTRGGFKRKDGFQKHVQAKHPYLVKKDFESLNLNSQVKHDASAQKAHKYRADGSAVHGKRLHQAFTEDQVISDSESEVSDDHRSTIKRLRRTIESQRGEIQTIREHLESVQEQHANELERMERSHEKELERLHGTIRFMTSPENKRVE